MTKGKFHERFEISINIDETKRRFVNRFYNLVNSFHYATREKINQRLATDLGELYVRWNDVAIYIKDDFYRCLEALEFLYNYRIVQLEPGFIENFLSKSEIDLGVKWSGNEFIKAGAKILDKKLINENLRWLSVPRYKNVYEPFEKGLRHFLEAEKRPELLYDAVTDMYESLESLAKIIVGNARDLSGNAEILIAKIKVSEKYKDILKDYISYANEFRHGLDELKRRERLSMKEVESFIYLTGLFIRLAIEEK